MTNRRIFLTGMLASGLTCRTTWADAGNPAFLSAGMKADGTHVLCGLTNTGQRVFSLPLPARGHAAAAHPERAEAVAFARRPGTYAIVLDCINGSEKARLDAPAGRHFYGHGTYSARGDLLFTTENDYDAARGVIGLWDVRQGYKRIGEFSSGGVGPHDLKLMPDGKTLVVANGGIETHPQTGRVKLNLATMRSNLCYLDLEGKIINRILLDGSFQKSSIRHLAVAQNSKVAFAMQWQGDLTSPLPLLGLHTPRTDKPEFAPAASVRHLNGYLGSIAITPDGHRICVTSPRAGIIQEFRHTTPVRELRIADVCGVAASAGGFVLTSGTGLVKTAPGRSIPHPLAWDNHLIAL